MKNSKSINALPVLLLILGLTCLISCEKPNEPAEITQEWNPIPDWDEFAFVGSNVGYDTYTGWLSWDCRYSIQKIRLGEMTDGEATKTYYRDTIHTECAQMRIVGVQEDDPNSLKIDTTYTTSVRIDTSYYWRKNDTLWVDGLYDQYLNGYKKSLLNHKSKSYGDLEINDCIYKMDTISIACFERINQGYRSQIKYGFAEGLGLVHYSDGSFSLKLDYTISDLKRTDYSNATIEILPKVD